MRYSKDFLNEKYKHLLEIVKDAMGSVDRANLIRSIAEKHKLHIDLAGLLLEEIMYVTLGVEKSVDFIKNLKVYLRLPEDKANAIARDVNEKIFLPIREALKKVADNSAQNMKQSNEDLGKEDDKENPYLETKPISESAINRAEESEDIKHQIEKQNITKPVAPFPPNLPKEPELEIKPLSEEKKPVHIDPYREPI